jgi:hypothetical protein
MEALRNSLQYSHLFASSLGIGLALDGGTTGFLLRLGSWPKVLGQLCFGTDRGVARAQWLRGLRLRLYDAKKVGLTRDRVHHR